MRGARMMEITENACFHCGEPIPDGISLDIEQLQTSQIFTMPIDIRVTTTAGTQDFDSVDHTDCVIVIGANPTDGHPVFASRMKRRLREGVEFFRFLRQRFEALRPETRRDEAFGMVWSSTRTPGWARSNASTSDRRGAGSAPRGW